jgi:hypothetical protein
MKGDAPANCGVGGAACASCAYCTSGQCADFSCVKATGKELDTCAEACSSLGTSCTTCDGTVGGYGGDGSGVCKLTEQAAKTCNTPLDYPYLIACCCTTS